jgi:acyl-CoA thioesterase-2
MSDALSNLLSMLDLESLGGDQYVGLSPGGTRRRLFGGHVAAQALMAAGRSVPGVPAHSLHAYFLRPGDPNQPIEYRVERLRDGRSYAARSVSASQQGRVILQATASFHEPENVGLEHQRSAPVVPPPAACVSWEDWMAPRVAQLPVHVQEQIIRERPIEIRPIDPIDALDPKPSGTRQSIWCRADGELPDDALLQQCVATYASDHTLLGSVLRPHGLTFLTRGVMAASLDHAIWFHRPFRMDAWILYAQETPVAFGGRGLAHGHFFDAQGTLVASVAQEGVLRQR